MLDQYILRKEFDTFIQAKNETLDIVPKHMEAYMQLALSGDLQIDTELIHIKLFKDNDLNKIVSEVEIDFCLEHIISYAIFDHDWYLK